MARPLTGRRIVVADDHDESIDLICGLLEWMGHECHGAGTAETALALVHRLDPDLAFLDITLPDASGFDVARVIRRTARRQPYLVAMTGWLHTAHRERALDAGFDAHIVKPLDTVTLEKIVGARAARVDAPVLAIVR